MVNSSRCGFNEERTVSRLISTRYSTDWQDQKWQIVPSCGLNQNKDFRLCVPEGTFQC